MPCEPPSEPSPGDPDRRLNRRELPCRRQQYRSKRYTSFQHVQIWPDWPVPLLLVKQHQTQAPYDAIHKAARIQSFRPCNRRDVGPGLQRRSHNPRLLVIRPVSWPPSASHRLRRQNLECPGLIHTVAHRILRMIHAENRPSHRRKIRGIVYPLTQKLSGYRAVQDRTDCHHSGTGLNHH